MRVEGRPIHGALSDLLLQTWDREPRLEIAGEIEPEIIEWCERNLGRPAAELIFTHHHLSTVLGLRLTNGLEVVLKMRPFQDRIYPCFDIQRHLWRRGFSCPEPLTGPTRFKDMLVTAERYVPGGEIIPGSIATAPQYASHLADLVDTASLYQLRETLEPTPAWMAYEHIEPGLWPPPDDLDVDLNAAAEPAWLDDAASRASAFLRETDLPRVIGHIDWHAGNLRWQGTKLLAAHDWDSLAYLPEAAIAGSASVLYTASLRSEANLDDSQAFFDAYATARHQPWSEEERRVAWAAGLWNYAFDAKKSSIDGIGASLERLQIEVEARLKLAGLA